MNILMLFNILALKSINPMLFKVGLILIDITGLILLIAVIFKFFEYYDKKPKNEKQKGHFFSTFGMTMLVIILFNFWTGSIGQINVIDRITQYIYFILGSILLLIGFIWHIIAKVNIGRYWSDDIEIKPEHNIIQTGAYSFARHPMYASLLMWCFGASFITFNYASFLITGLIFFPLMVIRAKAEEKELLEKNSDYIIYKQNTKMLCPTLKGNFALFVKIVALILFMYFVIKGIEPPQLLLLFFMHLYLGYSLTPEKVAFSYRSKSGIILIVWLISKYFYPAYYFLYVVGFMLLYGLKWNCPCMFMYEKYGGCPCFKLLKKFSKK